MDSAFSYSGKTVTIQGNDYYVPPFSKWEEKCKCGPCHIAYFPAIDKYFCNQWECSFLFPSIIIILTTLTFAFGEWSLTYTTSGTLTIVLCIIGALIYIVWWVAYLQSMCRSAGYLPWYWFVEKREEYTYEEQMGGIITTDEQMEFARDLDRPERAILSAKARRIVLRADHICKWIGNWVGLKNYRFFFIQLIWFVMLFIFFFIVCAFEIVDMAKNGWHTYPPRICMFIVFIPVMLFFIFFLIVFVRHVRYLVTNNTTVHELKSEKSNDFTNPYDLGCWQNCIETLGPAKYCPIWFCPCWIPRSNDGFTWRRNDQEEQTNLYNYDDHTTQDSEQIIEIDSVPPSGQDFFFPTVPNPMNSPRSSYDDGNEFISPSNQNLYQNEKPKPENKQPEENKEVKQEQQMIKRMPAPPTKPNSNLIPSSEQNQNKTLPQPLPSQKADDQPPKQKRRRHVKQNDPNNSQQNGEKKAQEPRKRKQNHDGFMDALVDRTLDGEDDDDFDLYTKGEKVAPIPPKQPVKLRIKQRRQTSAVPPPPNKNTVQIGLPTKPNPAKPDQTEIRQSKTLSKLPKMKMPEPPGKKIEEKPVSDLPQRKKSKPHSKKNSVSNQNNADGLPVKKKRSRSVRKPREEFPQP